MSSLSPRDMQARQLASKPIAEVLALRVKPKFVKFESWIEGSRSAAAELDSGIQLYRLKISYWREHKVGWRRVRVVYGVEGPADRVAAFRKALDKWVAEMQAT